MAEVPNNCVALYTKQKEKRGFPEHIHWRNTSTGGALFPWKNYSCVKGHKGNFFSEIVWLIVFVGYHAKQYNYVMYVVFCQQRGGGSGFPLGTTVQCTVDGDSTRVSLFFSACCCWPLLIQYKGWAVKIGV